MPPGLAVGGRGSAKVTQPVISRDRGRAFQAFIGLGPRATIRNGSRLLGMLDSLRVISA